MIFTRDSLGLRASVIKTKGAWQYQQSPLMQKLVLPQDANGHSLFSMPSKKFTPDCPAWKSCLTSNWKIITYILIRLPYLGRVLQF